MSRATCALRASGARFAAKRYLATSSLTAQLDGENAFEFAVSEAPPEAHDQIVADAMRFLTAPHLSLDRLFGFPGVERVQLVFRLGLVAVSERALVLPPQLCAEVARHRLQLVFERA